MASESGRKLAASAAGAETDHNRHSRANIHGWGRLVHGTRRSPKSAEIPYRPAVVPLRRSGTLTVPIYTSHPSGDPLRATSLGIDIGSTTVKVVALDGARRLLGSRYVRSCGRPRTVVGETVADLGRTIDLGGVTAVGLSGSGGGPIADLVGGTHVNELVAQTRAVGEFHPDARTIIEIGGQDSKLLSLRWDEGSRQMMLEDFAMNALCAAGTGAFLDQQAERLGIAIDGEFARLAMQSVAPPRIAGRCTVFAKSDMIHLQQVGTPMSDILMGVCLAMARNFTTVIGKGKRFVPPILFQGGVAYNAAVKRAFETVLGVDPGTIIVPEHHTLMAALGAAYVALEARADGQPARPFVGFARLEDLARTSRGAAAGPRRAPARRAAAPRERGGRRSAGDGHGGRVARRRRGVGEHERGAHRRARTVCWPAGTSPPPDGRWRPCAKGCGRWRRRSAIAWWCAAWGPPAPAGISPETSSAPTRCATRSPPRRGPPRRPIRPSDTVIEIGGQDSKFIRLHNGAVTDFTMNNACAAGTGSFLQEQADRLQIRIEEQFSDLAFESSCPAALGERCTVFMESDLVHHQQQGAQVADLTAGLAYSIAENYLNRVVNGRPLGARISLPGRRGVERGGGRRLLGDARAPDHRAAQPRRQRGDRRRHPRARGDGAPRGGMGRRARGSGASISRSAATRVRCSSARPAPTSARCTR